MSASQLDLIKDFLLENYPEVCNEKKDNSISDLVKTVISRQNDNIIFLTDCDMKKIVDDSNDEISYLDTL